MGNEGHAAIRDTILLRHVLTRVTNIKGLFDGCCGFWARGGLFFVLPGRFLVRGLSGNGRGAPGGRGFFDFVLFCCLFVMFLRRTGRTICFVQL